MVKIGIIIVLYNNKVHLENIKSDNVDIIVVDNTPKRNIKEYDEFTYIPLFENKGIASAQNTGIQKAIELGCSHIIFFDQDSRITTDFIFKILHEYESIHSLYPNLFILGPTVINGRTEKEYKSTIHNDTTSSKYKDFIPRSTVISSGSIVSIDAIRTVGLLDDTLFIDYVDFEWCWRASKKGFINGISRNVTLIHYVGQNEYKIMNQLIIISAPIRYYFQMRNYIWLCKRAYVPLQWKINTGIKKVFHHLTYPFKVINWKLIYLYSLKGLVAGFKGNSRV